MAIKPLRIALLTYHKENGGAGIACGRLAEALRNAGHEVTYLDAADVAKNTFQKAIAWLRFILERLYFLGHERDKSIRFLFNPGIFGQDLSTHPALVQADIIHIHWVNFGFLGIGDIQKLIGMGKPVFWTLHDMWAFTGGCHHSGSCTRYEENCGQCPFLKSPAYTDLSHQLWGKKWMAFRSNNLKIITCSEWLGAKAKSSSILSNHEIQSIPNALDLQKFAPIQKTMIKTNLGLDIHKKYILFVAMRASAPAKGFSYLKQAIDLWVKNNPESKRDTELLVIGEIQDPAAFEALALPARLVGKLTDHKKMAEYYAAADVFVTPSLEENLPNTIMEAMACGTPCVGFHVGGIPEMINHQINGYVAKSLNAEDLADGIQWTLQHPEAGQAARKKAETNYAALIVAQKHVDFYQKALAEIAHA
jgi:glycosyltransferase involved in cell wall biosynthesis